jgi:hypothetical protein
MSKINSLDLLHAIREIPKSVIKSNEKLVLFTLLACINGDNLTWHSMESIAKLACLSPRCVTTQLHSLAKKQLIKILPPKTYGTYSTNHYNLNTDQILLYLRRSPRAPQARPPANGATDHLQNLHRPPAPFAGDHLHHLHTKKEIEEERRRSAARAVPSGVASASVKKMTPEEIEADFQEKLRQLKAVHGDRS